ncbi:hypothetical protein SMKC058_11640 [Serratia marcescens]|nr:hypothetical protein SMKC058_11640 [Serratia marcescens]
MDAVLATADVGCFATYISKQGGVLVSRKYHVVRTAYTLADKPNTYGDHGTQIYGIWSPRLGHDSRICTHTSNWQMVRKTANALTNIATGSTGGEHVRFDFDLQGGPSAPWTSGNNCPFERDTNSLGAGIATYKEPQSIDFEQLGYKERRELLKRLRTPGQKTLSDRPKRQLLTLGEHALSSPHDELIEKLDDYAYTLGIDISRAALRRLVLGETVNIGDMCYRAGYSGSLYITKSHGKKTSVNLLSRFRKALKQLSRKVSFKVLQ